MVRGRAAAPSLARTGPVFWGWQDTSGLPGINAFPGGLSGGLPCQSHPSPAGTTGLRLEGAAQGRRALPVNLLIDTSQAEIWPSHPQHMARSTDISANCCDPSTGSEATGSFSAKQSKILKPSSCKARFCQELSCLQNHTNSYNTVSPGTQETPNLAIFIPAIESFC